MHSRIAAIEYFLPEKILTTEELSALFPEWAVEKIDRKTGIRCRHIARYDEYASDLAMSAARRLFESGPYKADEVDFLLLCTQSPDYILPTTACLLQDRLGIRKNAGALDYNLGCSGFVYGLGLAEGLIASGQAETILLLTADTYSKYLDKNDKSSRVIFGDGASATLIKARFGDEALRSCSFVYGTDGAGAQSLIVPNSATRRNGPVGGRDCNGSEATDSRRDFLFMDGHKMFDFAIRVVPESVKAVLRKSNLTLDSIDLFVFHQANAYLLEEIRRLLGIPQEKFQVTISHCGNTVSSTIPIALKEAAREGRLRKGSRVMLVAFGVGYSWAATTMQWD